MGFCLRKLPKFNHYGLVWVKTKRMLLADIDQLQQARKIRNEILG